MATHGISILGHATIPDASGKVWQEPYSLLATNDVWKHLVFRFDEDGANNAQISTRVGIYGVFVVPNNYVGTAAIVPMWTSTVTSGNCVFDFDYRAISGDDTESLDQSGTQESVSVTDAAPSAAHERNTPSMSLTSANLAAGDLVEFYFVVDGTDGNDTLAGARLLHDLVFSYADA
jgi:hypothetical protein